jgi:hypothetical protein
MAYARAGLAVFPLRPSSKAPLISSDDGGRGFHDATIDPEQIHAWWTATPNANIGLRPPHGVLALDVDPRAGGDLALRRITRLRGKLPDTWAARAQGSLYSLGCLQARISAAPEGRRNKVLYGALKDALRDGNLDGFEHALTAAAIGRGLSAREVAATVSSVRRSVAP